MSPKISVIVPIYKVEKYLKTCLDSLIKQTYGNLEIILVNDDSPDRCGDICEEYAAKDNRFQVIHKSNGGPSDARNAGLDAATGEYVSFIDPDDYIREDFYETFMKLMISHDADIVQCHFLKVYEEGYPAANQSDQSDILNHRHTVTILNNREALHQLYTNDYRYLSTVVLWNKLYKKHLFQSIRFPPGKIHEDEHVIYRILYRTRMFVVTSEPMYFYLQRPDSYMGNKFDHKRLAVLDAYFDQIHFYRDNKLSDLESKAKINFEGSIRNVMSHVLYSEMEDKDKVFHSLVEYYRQHYELFRNPNDQRWKKIIMLLFRYGSMNVIKWLIRVKYHKNAIQHRSG